MMMLGDDADEDDDETWDERRMKRERGLCPENADDVDEDADADDDDDADEDDDEKGLCPEKGREEGARSCDEERVDGMEW